MAVSKQRIMIVDDDNNIAELISLYLIKECFEAEIYNDGESALEALDTYKPNLILLDLMLPGMDGYQVCREVRARSNTPIIMLSAKGEVFDKVLGLELGADDYISKPFSIREVMVRVRAVLRRTASRLEGAEEPAVISYQGLLLNLNKKSVSVDGEDVPFTKTEFELLRLLLEERGRVFSRQELIDRVWPKDVLVLDRTVDVNITRMRKKIGKFAKCIVTRLGFGYYFDA